MQETQIWTIQFLSVLNLGCLGSLDPIEEGERIDAFWQVYILDKAWAVALKSPSSISEDGLWGTQIDTPWPLRMQEYEQVCSPKSVTRATAKLLFREPLPTYLVPTRSNYF